MKKILVFMCVLAMMAFAVPAFAELFTNGGFETGDYTGWTVTYGRLDTPGSATPASPNWTSFRSDQPLASILTAATVNPNQTLDVDPYNGSKMAMISNYSGSIMQLSCFYRPVPPLTAADLTKTVYVNWGTMLVDPNHSDAQNPYFSISVLINGIVVDSFAANANQTNVGGVATPPLGASRNEPVLQLRHVFL